MERLKIRMDLDNMKDYDRLLQNIMDIDVLLIEEKRQLV